MEVIINNQFCWQYINWEPYFINYEIEFRHEQLEDFSENVLNIRDPEMAAREIAKFYGQTCDHVLCIVSGLYLDELPMDDPRQPGFEPRVRAGRKWVEGNLDQYYAAFSQQLGGDRPCRAVDAFAVYHHGTIESFIAVHDDQKLLLADKPFPDGYWGRRIYGILQDAASGYYLADPQTDPEILQEWAVRAKQYRERTVKQIAALLDVPQYIAPVSEARNYRYTVDVHWNPDFSGLQGEVGYAASRAFARELGCRSDSVGWAHKENVTPEFMDELEGMTQKTGAELRGGMGIYLSEPLESGWYRLHMEYGAEDGWAWERFRWEEYPEEKPVIRQFKSYLAAPAYPIMAGIHDEVCYVPEHVKTALQNLCGDAVDFLWLEDIGRYEAVQYYNLLPKTMLKSCLGGFDCVKAPCRGARTAAAACFGETAARLSRLFGELMISLEFGVYRSWLPDSGITGFIKNTENVRELLLRQDIRNGLIAAGVCKESDFEPLRVFEDDDPCACDWPEVEGCLPVVPEVVRSELERRHAKLMKKKRPKRTATEKTALKALRLLKKEDPGNFGKRIPPAVSEQLTVPQLLPYYKLSNGFSFAEYDIFRAEELTEKTAELLQMQESENFALDDLVAAFGYSDGEWLLLLTDGRVVRYAVGDPLWIAEWPTLAMFMQETAEKTRTEWL
ncbi:MAG: hypothetical protein IJ452_08670 [Butyricicoccus sp.]|nr:hypothetical protein [Butyricicoccus sp.]